ncbi:hypothetical protein ACMDCT_08580 [Halomonadaceae bacterium KBTZ08]
MKRLRPLLLLVLMTLLAGCSVFQPNSNTNPGAENNPDCEWTPVRGIAELVRFEDNTALMDFFPGGIRFQTDASDHDWTPGDEFKVLLETPDPPECGAPRVRKLSPLEPDA